MRCFVNFVGHQTETKPLWEPTDRQEACPTLQNGRFKDDREWHSRLFLQYKGYLCACGKRRENHAQITRTAILKGSLSESNNEDMEHQFWGERASLCVNTAAVLRSTNVRPLHSCSVHRLSLLLVFLLQTPGGCPESQIFEGTKIYCDRRVVPL